MKAAKKWVSQPMKIPITATMARLDLRDELHEQVQKTIQQE
jgi:hypothetical protein